MLPRNTQLGTLEYVEVIDYYDFPQFFSCKNELGTTFLGLAIEDNPLTYLFGQVELETLSKRKLKTELPVKLLWWYGSPIYRVEMLLSTGDTATLMTKEESGKLLEELL